MNTFQLKCFLEVANTLSFAKAAEHLRVSQPTVTNQIKSLEEELDAKLFRRPTRLVEITPEGRAFVTDAKSMVNIAEQARLRFARPSGQPVNNLSIGCGSYIQSRLLTEVINRIYTEVPNFHPRLFVVQRENLFHLLDTDQADVIFDIREGCERKGNLKFRELAQSDIVCVCRSDSRFAGKDCLTLEELTDESVIFCDPMNLSPEIARLQFRLAEGRTPANTHFAASSEASIVLAGAGVGIAFLPDIYIPNETRLKKLRLEGAPKFSFGMFYKSYPGDSLLKRFIQATAEYFREMTKSSG